MTDDLVARLLDWPYQGETMAHEAADSIKQLVATNKQLTAERDDALECNEQFFVYNQFLKKRAEAAEAERDRLRAAGEKAICHITGYGEASTARIELRAALKGEKP